MNPKRFLTVEEFAREKDITRQTVYRWIRIGRIKPLESGPRPLISEDYLSLPLMQGIINKSILLSNDEIKVLLDEGKSFGEIATVAGVSRQRIEQIYKRDFSSSMSSGMDRRKKLVRDRRKKKAENHLYTVEKLSILREEAEKVGLEIKPIQSDRVLHRYYHDRVSVNDRLCRVYFSKTACSVSNRSYRFYHKVPITKSLLTKCDFIIVITENESRYVFIFPSSVILSLFSEEDTHKTLHIPDKFREPYNNMLPKINWWDYEARWDLLLG